MRLPKMSSFGSLTAISALVLVLVILALILILVLILAVLVLILVLAVLALVPAVVLILVVIHHAETSFLMNGTVIVWTGVLGFIQKFFAHKRKKQENTTAIL